MLLTVVQININILFVKSVKDIPCAVGFGISTPEQAKEMAKNADGVIVGSAIVRICAKYGTTEKSHAQTGLASEPAFHDAVLQRKP